MDMQADAPAHYLVRDFVGVCVTSQEGYEVSTRDFGDYLIVVVSRGGGVELSKVYVGTNPDIPKVDESLLEDGNNGEDEKRLSDGTILEIPKDPMREGYIHFFFISNLKDFSFLKKNVSYCKW